MAVFAFFSLFLCYFCCFAFPYYIQAKRFDYDPYSMMMYNQMYSHENWAPYRSYVGRSDAEALIPNFDVLADGGTMEKRVTADQINSLLKNAWLGR